MSAGTTTRNVMAWKTLTLVEIGNFLIMLYKGNSNLNKKATILINYILNKVEQVVNHHG